MQYEASLKVWNENRLYAGLQFYESKVFQFRGGVKVIRIQDVTRPLITFTVCVTIAHALILLAT